MPTRVMTSGQPSPPTEVGVSASPCRSASVTRPHPTRRRSRSATTSRKYSSKETACAPAGGTGAEAAATHGWAASTSEQGRSIRADTWTNQAKPASVVSHNYRQQAVPRARWREVEQEVHHDRRAGYVHV